jgi:hypothetical protein
LNVTSVEGAAGTGAEGAGVEGDRVRVGDLDLDLEDPDVPAVVDEGPSPLKQSAGEAEPQSSV